MNLARQLQQLSASILEPCKIVQIECDKSGSSCSPANNVIGLCGRSLHFAPAATLLQDAQRPQHYSACSRPEGAEESVAPCVLLPVGRVFWAGLFKYRAEREEENMNQELTQSCHVRLFSHLNLIFYLPFSCVCCRPSNFDSKQSKGCSAHPDGRLLQTESSSCTMLL